MPTSLQTIVILQQKDNGKSFNNCSKTSENLFPTVPLTLIGLKKKPSKYFTCMDLESDGCMSRTNHATGAELARETINF